MRVLLLLLSALVGAVSCSGGDEGRTPGDTDFMGTLTVIDANGRPVLYGERAGAAYAVGGPNDATLFLYGVRFAETMPPTDLAIPECGYTAGNSILVFTGYGLIPCDREGNPRNEWRIDELHGELYDGELTLVFRSTDMRVSYRGYRVSD